LYNDVFWQNRSFYIGVGNLGTGTTNQQNVVALYNAFVGGQVANQPSADAQTANSGGTIITGGTGACFPSTNNYWDLGVRGDTGPSDHSSTVTLNPVYSLITAGYTGTATNHNANSNPAMVSQYCNGSRTPPEYVGGTWQVPPGIADATVPNPLFNLQPNATVDEGNNWINISWGPLTMFNPLSGAPLGNYGPVGGSPVVNYIPSSANGATGAYTLAPLVDFFGNQRKSNNAVDAGAVEFQAPPGVNVFPTTLNFPNTVEGTAGTALALTLYNNTASALNQIAVNITAPFSRANAAQGGPGTCGPALPPGGSCSINVVFNAPATPGTSNGNATLTANITVNGSPVALTGTSVVAVRTLKVSPNPLAFGNWFTGTASGAQTLTVTNIGNVATTTGITVAFGGAAPQTFSRPAGAAGGTCATGKTLAPGESCTVDVIFTAPGGLTANTSYSRTLSVSSAGEAVTPASVTLTATGVPARATVSISPNPLTITLPTGRGNITGVGVVTLTNAAAAGGTSTHVSSVVVSPASLQYSFNIIAGTNTCTGANLTPGASCTVTVRFTNLLAPRGVNRTGTITFTDTATGSPQSAALVGFATP
jgi:hypothetical protein